MLWWLGWWCARLPLSKLCQGFFGIQVPWVLPKVSALQDFWQMGPSCIHKGGILLKIKRGSRGLRVY